MTAEGLAAMTAEGLAAMTVEGLAAVTAESLAAMTAEGLAAVTVEGLAAVTAEGLAAVTAEGLAAERAETGAAEAGVETRDPCDGAGAVPTTQAGLHPSSNPPPPLPPPPPTLLAAHLQTRPILFCFFSHYLPEHTGAYCLHFRIGLFPHIERGDCVGACVCVCCVGR